MEKGSQRISLVLLDLNMRVCKLYLSNGRNVVVGMYIYCTSCVGVGDNAPNLVIRWDIDIFMALNFRCNMDMLIGCHSRGVMEMFMGWNR